MNNRRETSALTEAIHDKSTLRRVGEAAVWLAAAASLVLGAVYVAKETGDIGPLFDIPGIGDSMGPDFEPQNGDPVMGSMLQ